MRGGDHVSAACESVRARPPSSSSTHVSLDPPPWLELTIIEPSRRATRVSPPGTIRMSSPNTANGRRSTWRRASAPSGPAVGTVDSFTRSCAIHFSGRRLISAACAAICSSVAVGPMNTPLPPDSDVGLTTTWSSRSSTHSRCSRSLIRYVGTFSTIGSSPR